MKRLYYLMLAGTLALSSAARNVSAQTKRFVDGSVAASGNGSCWDEALKTIEEAIVLANDEAEPPEQIWVRAGIYKPASAGSSFNLKKRVWVYGGFSGTENCETFNPETDPRPFMLSGTESPTILSGDLGNNDDQGIFTENVLEIVKAPAFDETEDAFRLDGFTVLGAAHHAIFNDRKANGIYRRCTVRNNRGLDPSFGGAGMYNNDANPRIDRCDFIDNFVVENSGVGGAIYNLQSSPVITSCKFLTNWCSNDVPDPLKGGGAMYSIGTPPNAGSSPMVRHCLFEDNIAFNAHGGAVCTDGGASHFFIDCVFRGNRVFLSPEAEPDTMLQGGAAFSHRFGTFVNCIFDSNMILQPDEVLPDLMTPRGQGGGMYISEDMILTNCLFFGNVAESGGGLFVEWALLTASHLTVAENLSLTEGAGVYVNNPLFHGAPASFANSIFWGNRGDGNASLAEQQVFLGAPDTVLAVTRSCVEDGTIDANHYAGVGNVDDDPEFYNVDPIAPPNYRLRSCSPLLDLGDKQATPADQFNVDEDSDTLSEKTPDVDLNIRDIDAPLAFGNLGYPPVDMGSYEFQGNLHADILLGDMNGDGEVNDDDVPGFIAVRVLYPPPGTPILAPEHAVADMNQDGDIDYRLDEQDDQECFISLVEGLGNPCDGICFLGPVIESMMMAGIEIDDCNGNGIGDAIDMARPFLSSLDCNDNGVIDECDIASGASADANGNRYPDECDAAVGILPTDDPVAEDAAFEREVLADLERQFYEWVISRPWGPDAGDSGSAQFSLIVDKRRELGLPLLNRWIIDVP